MIASALAIGNVYAAALFELALQDNAVNEINEDLSSMDHLAGDSKEFMIINSSPYFSSEYKSQLLEKLFRGKITSLTFDFLQIVNKHNRMPYLRAIAQQYEKLYDEHLGRSLIEVTVSKQLDQAEIQSLAADIAAAFKTEVKLNVRIDHSIIGGVIIRRGDMIIDNSIKTQLREAVRAITSHHKKREKVHEI